MAQAAGKAKLIDGAATARELRERVGRRVAALRQHHDLQPGLTVVLVGNNPASEIYVRSKLKFAAEAGMVSRDIRLPDSVTQAELLATIAALNADPAVDGILVQMPLPRQIDPGAITDAIDPAKDVDGFHPVNTGFLVAGRPGLVPCTPLGCIMLLRQSLGNLSGLDAVVIGRSDIVGKPMAILLLREHCTVTVAHSRTRDLPALCRRAEILCVAIGHAELIRGDWIRPGATVIDIGINRVSAGGKSRIVGDVNFAQAREVAGAITPVPGGVGPMTIACLLFNTLRAACMQAGLPAPEI
jgi:methylenetetrahydrofolate dehydrogenase (NADP+) / methenyltetrahydrofolate cyclohydrolase